MRMDSGTLYDITNLIDMCRNEPVLDRQLKILLVINAMLPLAKKLHIPSFLTDECTQPSASDFLKTFVLRKALSNNDMASICTPYASVSNWRIPEQAKHKYFCIAIFIRRDLPRIS